METVGANQVATDEAPCEWIANLREAPRAIVEERRGVSETVSDTGHPTRIVKRDLRRIGIHALERSANHAEPRERAQGCGPRTRARVIEVDGGSSAVGDDYRAVGLQVEMLQPGNCPPARYRRVALVHDDELG